MFNIKPEDLVSKTDKILYNIYELLREDLLLHSMRKSTEEVNKSIEISPMLNLPISLEGEFIVEKNPKKPRKPRGTPAKKRKPRKKREE